jgi:hypothetical protein
MNRGLTAIHYCLIVGAGYFLWDWCIQKLKLVAVKKHVTVWVSGLAILACGIHYTTINLETPHQHAATFDLEQTSQFFKERRHPNHRIDQEYPADIPLEYYLVKNKVPFPNFRDRVVSGAYLYVLLCSEAVHTIASTCAERRIDTQRLGEPTLVYSEKRIKIYKCEVY